MKKRTKPPPGKDGRIRRKDSHGRDYPPKG
jgi:hypothetical protein